jgi:predicted nucleic acid-binding Zn ribbon protein
MNRDEFIAESKRLQAEYDRRRNRGTIVIVLTALAVCALAFVLAACQVPLR